MPPAPPKTGSPPIQDLGPQDFKGIVGPVKIWAALRPTSVESRFQAMHAGGLTELVGRENSISALPHGEILLLQLREWTMAIESAVDVVVDADALRARSSRNIGKSLPIRTPSSISTLVGTWHSISVTTMYLSGHCRTWRWNPSPASRTRFRSNPFRRVNTSWISGRVRASILRRRPSSWINRQSDRRRHDGGDACKIAGDVGEAGTGKRGVPGRPCGKFARRRRMGGRRHQQRRDQPLRR